MKNLFALSMVVALLTIGIGILVLSKGRPSPIVTSANQGTQLEYSSSNSGAAPVNPNSQAVTMPKPSESPRAANYELPASIQAYLAQPKQRPKMTGLPLVDAAGEDLLIRKYREIDAFTNKPGLIRLMAYTGGDKVFELFANTLTNELAGRSLSRPEEAIVGYMPQLIGVLARKSDAAFEFLQAGLQPAFWQPNATWKTQTGSDQPRILIGACIKGLALSGRNEGKEIVYGFRTQGANSYLRAIDGSVVDSAFVLDYMVLP